MHIKNTSDITFTLVASAFETYRITSHTDVGASFVEAHIPGDTPERTLSADDRKEVMEKARRCAVTIYVE
jgi:hypothetical protein